MEPVLDWEARYREQTTGWERDHINPAFTEWRSRLEQLGDGAGKLRAIVPGCGRSPELLELARMGYAVTGIDLADTAVATQHALLADEGLDGEVRQDNVLSYQPNEACDLIYEQTCLCALSPDQWPAYAEQLYCWLKPGAILAVLFMQTGREGGPPFHCDLDAMRELFSADRWQWDEQALKSEHPTGIHELGYWLTRR